MRLVAAIALAVGVPGCITPSIPIPPPDPTQMEIDPSIPIPPPEPGMQVEWVFTYPATSTYANGTWYLFNRNTGKGTIQTGAADGSVTGDVEAALGDNVNVSVVLEAETASTCIVLQSGKQDPNVYCQ